MKVKIGPYLTWWGPYQIAALLFGNPEKTYRLLDGEPQSWRLRWSEKLGDWLASTKFADLCQWIHDKRERQVYVKIDNYDVWNMDATLSLILAPMFKRLNDIKHGFARIDDEDVPTYLRSTEAPAVENSWESDDNAPKRYQWLLDEMIWVFSTDHDTEMHKFYDYGSVDKTADFMEQVRACKVDHQALEAYQKRVQNAYRLFGKYYQTFWD